jgi:hypothetical protein
VGAEVLLNEGMLGGPLPGIGGGALNDFGSVL